MRFLGHHSDGALFCLMARAAHFHAVLSGRNDHQQRSVSDIKTIDINFRIARLGAQQQLGRFFSGFLLKVLPILVFQRRAGARRKIERLRQALGRALRSARRSAWRCSLGCARLIGSRSCSRRRIGVRCGARGLRGFAGRISRRRLAPRRKRRSEQLILPSPSLCKFRASGSLPLFVLLRPPYRKLVWVGFSSLRKNWKIRCRSQTTALQNTGLLWARG